jgi:thymidylate synthase
MELNKYYKLLNKIVIKGKLQSAKKANSYGLINQKLSFNKKQLEHLFSVHPIAKTKLQDELKLYFDGITNVNEYNKKGITWWDYCKPELINSYPTYFKDLPKLINKINTLKPSKNYVLFIGNTLAETNQLPCLSLMQFQIVNNKINITVYQRSADCNLGLPSDLYQIYVISSFINLPLNNITFFIGNAHIYENNIEQTKNLLIGKPFKFNLNV